MSPSEVTSSTRRGVPGCVIAMPSVRLEPVRVSRLAPIASRGGDISLLAIDRPRFVGCAWPFSASRTFERDQYGWPVAIRDDRLISDGASFSEVMDEGSRDALGATTIPERFSQRLVMVAARAQETTEHGRQSGTRYMRRIETFDTVHEATAFERAAQTDDGHAQCHRLFQNAAGIADSDLRAREHLQKGQMFSNVDQACIGSKAAGIGFCQQTALQHPERGGGKLPTSLANASRICVWCWRFSRRCSETRTPSRCADANESRSR